MTRPVLRNAFVTVKHVHNGHDNTSKLTNVQRFIAVLSPCSAIHRSLYSTFAAINRCSGCGDSSLYAVEAIYRSSGTVVHPCTVIVGMNTGCTSTVAAIHRCKHIAAVND